MMRLLGLLLACATMACASTGASPQPFPVPGGGRVTAAPPTPTGSIDSYALTGTALALRGVPYRNGGADPSGFDCSGFVWYVFSQHGILVPRTVPEQFRSGRAVSGQPQAGDLVFFRTTTGPSHVGIALGGDAFVHAPSSTGVVRVERLSASYWSRRFLGARRPLDSRD
jgi:cell wall-associated NlpC family hydrolase